MSKYFPKPYMDHLKETFIYKPFGGNINIKVDLSN